MKLHINILLFLSIFFTSVNGQSLKTYSGNYSGINTNGKATYSYYENANEERIYNGNFKYSAIVNNVKVTLSGKFKNNKRVGFWQTNVKLLKPAGTRVGMSEKSTLYYKNGKLNGKASYSKILKDKWSGGISITTTSNYANFKNGLFYGKISSVFKNSGIITVSINGQFNNNGYMNGKWIIKYHENTSSFNAMKNSPIINDIREYKNGVLYKITIKNTSTGKIIDKANYSELTDKFIANYDTIFNVAYIDNKVYRYVDITNGGHVGTEYGNSQLSDLITWWNVSNKQQTLMYEISKGADSPDNVVERIISEYKPKQIYADVDYFIEKQDFDKAYLKNVTVYRTNPEALETYIRTTYIFLFTGKEARAEKGCMLGLEQVKIQKGSKNQELNLQCNLAHSYLFQGKYDKAKTIYLKYKDETINNIRFKTKILNDFIAFEKYGINNTAFDRIRNELK